MKRATTLAEIKRSLNPKPLKLEELAEFFVETSDARDPHLSRRDEIYERLDVEPSAKVLLAGHAGSGSSKSEADWPPSTPPLSNPTSLPRSTTSAMCNAISASARRRKNPSARRSKSIGDWPPSTPPHSNPTSR